MASYRGLPVAPLAGTADSFEAMLSAGAAVRGLNSPPANDVPWPWPVCAIGRIRRPAFRGEAKAIWRLDSLYVPAYRKRAPPHVS